jgi:hypothetical protein
LFIHTRIPRVPQQVVFEPAVSHVCSFCFSQAPASITQKPLKQTLRRGGDGSYGFVFDDVNGQVTVTGIDRDSANSSM